jgi:hypothetical protein
LSAQNSQSGDEEWTPYVANPVYRDGNGPLVLVDGGHGNFHTIDGRFGAFAALLQRDGYRVASADNGVTRAMLDDASVYVISNAVHGGDNAKWVLPTPSAFSDDEIDIIVDWVEDGGSLLLIADHMPFPGATAKLANEFGLVFLNGFALSATGAGGSLGFDQSDGSLADHPITRGRNEAEAVSRVQAFTGQAFRAVVENQPLLRMPDDWVVLLPSEAWEFDDTTPKVSARGLLQGAVLRHGAGRVAVFGEAAMFTAQNSVRDGVARPMGMNHPAASENAQFVLNVLHWLSGLLDN